MNFKELSDWKLTSEECDLLRKLFGLKEFAFFRDYIEKKLVKMAYDLAVGTPLEGIDKNELLNELRGACRFWKEITWKVDNLEEKKK